ncbi:MAG: hypothetical protein Q4C46_10190 [Bacillota bacterium]|nr:hypothetical protein [Bacillota bacterium]
MRRYGYEKAIYNNRKEFVDWFFAEPIKVFFVVAFALADCATVFVVFDAYLWQSHLLTYALTILFSLSLSIIPVQLAFAVRMQDPLSGSNEEVRGDTKTKKKRIIAFLLALESFAFSAQMAGRLFTTKAVTGASETITLDGSAANTGESAITAADYYGSILLGLLPLIFGGIIFAMHYLAQEKSVIDANKSNKELDRKLIGNRIREELAYMGSTENFIQIQMSRLKEQCRSIILSEELEHVSRVTDSQIEMAMTNKMNPADAHNIMVEPYPYVINGNNTETSL